MHDNERRIKATEHERLEAAGGHDDLNSAEYHNLDPSIGCRFT